MYSSKFTILAVLTTLTGLACSACAPLPPEHTVDWRNGAKRGWVSSVYAADAPRDTLPRCLAELPPEQLAQHRYVRIDYRHSRRMLTEVAPLPDGQEAQPGQRVELWPQDCDQGKLSRISRILPAA